MKSLEGGGAKAAACGTPAGPAPAGEFVGTRCVRCSGTGQVLLEERVLEPTPPPPPGQILVYRRYEPCREDDCVPDFIPLMLRESWTLEDEPKGE